MVNVSSVASRVADELAVVGLLTPEQLAWAHGQADATGTSAGRIALERDFVSETDVARVLEESLGVPRVDLASYSPDEDAVALVPERLARASGIVPLFEIDGVLTVAIGRASDIFDLDSLGTEIGLEVEAVLAEPRAVDGALAQCYGGAVRAIGEAPLAVSGGQGPSTAGSEQARAALLCEDGALEETLLPIAHQPELASRIDLDVLAVADTRRTALLVADILETAVARRATGVHVLPYLGDFFLVLRVDGRLEQLGHAPLSLQGALIDALRSFVRMPVATGSAPGVSRFHTEIAGTPVTLAASTVSTITGQRLVIGIEYGETAPRAIEELGMSDSEARALAALIERGRGFVLIAAPVGEGLDDTYYALLARAAGAARTVYSVERGSGPVIPAVAHVAVLPGAIPAASAYVAAGLGQDTDVVAIETAYAAEEVHLALEAAHAGKLVIVGVTAAGAAPAVRRLLDLGVEPVSLSAGLTVVIGQRSTRATSGARATLFEMMPVTEALRSAIAGSASVEGLSAAAGKAGVRPAVAPDTGSATQGPAVSDELDRAIRAAG